MGDTHSDASKHVKLYVGVFIALAVFTVLTVSASRLEVSTPVHVAVALLIAAVKASLVAAIFMHLKWERTSVLWMALALTAVLFVILLVVPVLSVHDVPPAVVMHTWG